jgi:hypothetical protein
MSSSSLWGHGNWFSSSDKLERTKSIKSLVWSVLEYWPAFVISAMAIVGAYQSYTVLKAEETRNADNTFLQHAGDRATVLMWELQRVIGDLQIVTAYMAVSFDWREDYFREKFKNLTAGILDRSPGTQGLTWVPMVYNPAERAMLEEQQARQLNLPGTPAQSRTTSSGQSVRCIYYKNAAGANLCSPSAPVGGPWNVGGPG